MDFQSSAMISELLLGAITIGTILWAILSVKNWSDRPDLWGLDFLDHHKKLEAINDTLCDVADLIEDLSINGAQASGATPVPNSIGELISHVVLNQLSNVGGHAPAPSETRSGWEVPENGSEESKETQVDSSSTEETVE